MDVVFILVMAMVFWAMYLLPSIIASRRQTKNRSKVLVINIFAGWTVIGWVVALAMSIKGEPRELSAT